MAHRPRRRLVPALAVVLVAALIPALTAGMASAAKSSNPTITLVAPSPAEGATLTAAEVAFAFSYNRIPKQTRSLTCTVSGPTASSGPCTAPTATAGGATSGSSHSGLANGSYTFTALLVLTDGGTASISRHFTVDVATQTCSGDLTASAPVQDGARTVWDVYGDGRNYPYPPGTSALDAVVYRGNDIVLDADLSSDCAGSWTYAWSYRLGDGPSVRVPADWPGATSAALTVPKWTLSFYDLTNEDYRFTVVATPPAGSSASPLSADLDLRVAGRAPAHAGYSPTGFTSEIPPGTYTYKAYGGVPSTALSPDWPSDDQEVGFIWYAEVFGADEIQPVSGQGTPVVDYRWTPAEFFLIRLTVCAVDAPNTPTNRCTSTPDFIFTTASG